MAEPDEDDLQSQEIVPFEHNGSMYTRIPGMGLCLMGSWGWEPVPEETLND